MKTTINIHVLPTDKVSSLYLARNGYFMFDPDIEKTGLRNDIKFHFLYITLPKSNLEISNIKEGDYYINKTGNVIEQNKYRLPSSGEFCEKIIASNDPSLKIEKLSNINDSAEGIHSYSLPLAPPVFISSWVKDFNGGNLVKRRIIDLVETTTKDGVTHQLKVNRANELVILMGRKEISISETYIQFKTAKIAKEKGFDLSSASYYSEETKQAYFNLSWNKEDWNNEGLKYNLTLKYPLYTRVTQSLFQKWLREVHGIHVCSTIDETLSWIWTVESLHPEASYTGGDRRSKYVYQSYEDALEEGLQTALELLQSN